MISFHIPGWYSGLTLDLSPKTKWMDGRVEPSTFFGRTPRFGSLDPHRLISELTGTKEALEKRLQSLGNDELQEETTWGME